MFERLFIGNKTVRVKEIGSTNTYMKQLITTNDNEIEGLVVVAKNQIKGRGQQGNDWESENSKNLTLSIYLKPNVLVQNQFLISKVVSLGIVDFLKDLGLSQLYIKWPNDIYCNHKKISGILNENSIRENKVYNTIAGIGLNVNQVNFNLENNPTSIINELRGEVLDLDKLLNQLLFFIEKRYMVLKSGKVSLIDKEYIDNLYWMNELKSFKIKDKVVEATIVGINSIGKLQVNINNKIEEFDLKEIEFLK